MSKAWKLWGSVSILSIIALVIMVGMYIQILDISEVNNNTSLMLEELRERSNGSKYARW